MKRILVVILLFLPLLGRSQGFFLPVSKSIAFENNKRGVASAWLLRPSFTLSAMEVVKSKTEGKVFDINSLTKAGFGVSYSHFVSVNNEPYNNYSINMMVLFDVVPTETAAFNVSPTVAFHAFQFIDLGFGYDTGNKRVFGLIGINYNFSK